MYIKKEHSSNIKEIIADLFRIQIPLPKSPLKYLNSYLIKGSSKSLIIDTGMNLNECYQAMIQSLNELSVDITKTDFFITHLHPDHIGLVSKLASTSKVYLSNIENNIVSESTNSSYYLLEMNKYLEKNGFPESELRGAFNSLNRIFIKTYPVTKEFKKIEFKALYDKDIINYGAFKLEGVLTPGHSPGHMCLYDADRKILFSGDHILFDITPNITWWPSMENPLKDFIESLNKIYNFDIKMVLPGHGETGYDHKKRIDEIKDHHKKRVEEIVLAIKKGKKTAYEIAESISWNSRYGGWELFPKTQKYFAVGETISHLIYLEHEGIIKSKITDETIYYTIL